MEREKFIREYNRIDDNESLIVSNEQIKELTNKSIDSTILEDKFRGESQLIITIEELNELSQQITKVLRGKYDKVHLLEEFVDVFLTLGYLKEVLNISNKEIRIASSIKYYRLKEELEKNKKTT